MATTRRRYSKEEFARRGDAIYESAVRPNLSPEDTGKFVAIENYFRDTTQPGQLDAFTADRYKSPW